MGLISPATLHKFAHQRKSGKALTPNTKLCAKCNFMVPTALKACEYCGTPVSVEPIDNHTFRLR
jgi:hypothetical protein